MFKMNLPEEIQDILNTLNENRHSAYVVGGCIRDTILGMQPHDYDIATSATPTQMKSIFENTGYEVIPTGERWGTVTLNYLIDNKQFEVTTFRSDIYYNGETADGRRPDEVKFGEDILEDLSRRDFTINAMAYNPLVGLIDPYKGQEDLNNKIIRCVGNPEDRLKEDGLRVLRAIRFAVRFNFDIEHNLKNFINRFGYDLLEKISKERIHDEIVKILSHKEFQNLSYNYISDFTTKLFGSYEIEVLPYYGLTLAYLFIEKPLYETEIWLRKYKFSNSDIKTILNYIKIYNYLSICEDEDHVDAYHIKKCFYLYGKFDTEQIIINLKDLWGTLCKEHKDEAFNICHLSINGYDIKNNYPDIPEIRYGDILKELLEFVWEDPNKNKKEYLLNLIKEIIK